jgi:hypothetical protein
MLGCSLVIVGEGDGPDYPVNVAMVVEMEINLVELLVLMVGGKCNRGGD